MLVSEATKAFVSKYWGPAAEYVNPQQVEAALTAAPFLQGVSSPRAQALEEAAQVAEQFRNNDWIAHDMRTGVFPKQSEPGVAIAAAIRALSPQPVAATRPTGGSNHGE